MSSIESWVQIPIERSRDLLGPTLHIFVIHDITVTGGHVARTPPHRATWPEQSLKHGHTARRKLNGIVTDPCRKRNKDGLITVKALGSGSGSRTGEREGEGELRTRLRVRVRKEIKVKLMIRLRTGARYAGNSFSQ